MGAMYDTGLLSLVLQYLINTTDIQMIRVCFVIQFRRSKSGIMEYKGHWKQDDMVSLPRNNGVDYAPKMPNLDPSG